MIMKKGWILLCFGLLSAIASANDRFADVQIKAVSVAENIYMLTGAGGNIGVLTSDEGLLLVDDQFLPLAERIEAALAKLTPAPLPVRYVINTHFHGDHVGANQFFAKQAPIFAHYNVRRRLAEKPHESSSLPVVTYSQGVNIHLGAEKVILTHLPNGHTDGDTIVYFKNARVVHTGDLLFNERFPFIDLKNGGSVKGYLTNLNALITMIPDNVKVIPGHGKLTDKQGIRKMIKMISFSLELVSKQLAKGSSREEIIARGLDGNYAQWGKHFISEKRWLETLVDDLSKG
jgi:glyoxylase-like metal-dependent hydrolase (beta-lactamase superfamily II)